MSRKVPTMIKLDPALKSEAQALCLAAGVSLASVIESNLRRWVARNRKKTQEEEVVTHG